MDLKDICSTWDEMHGNMSEFYDEVGLIVQEARMQNKSRKAGVMSLKFLECLSFCHSLINIDDTNLGDPLEVEMVKNTPFDFVYQTDKVQNKIHKIYYPKGRSFYFFISIWRYTYLLCLSYCFFYFLILGLYILYEITFLYTDYK